MVSGLWFVVSSFWLLVSGLQKKAFRNKKRKRKSKKIQGNDNKMFLLKRHSQGEGRPLPSPGRPSLGAPWAGPALIYEAGLIHPQARATRAGEGSPFPLAMSFEEKHFIIISLNFLTFPFPFLISESLLLKTRNQKPETRNHKPEAGNHKQETRSKKPETRNQKPEARSQKPESRSQKPEARNQKP
jgi:hypothetical protein